MKNIVFDLGGVVVDWSPQRLLENYPGDSELPLSLFKKGFFSDYWPEFDRGAVSQEKITEQMGDFASRPYAECWDFVEFIKHSLVDIPETLELIKDLSGQGYRLYCLSNMAVEFYDYLKDREVFRYFDGQIISALEGVIKPEEAIYRRLLDRYGLEAKESLFIDDLENNVEAARRLGFNTVNFADRRAGYQKIDEILGI